MGATSRVRTMRACRISGVERIIDTERVGQQLAVAGPSLASRECAGLAMVPSWLNGRAEIPPNPDAACPGRKGMTTTMGGV